MRRMQLVLWANLGGRTKEFREGSEKSPVCKTHFFYRRSES